MSHLQSYRCVVALFGQTLSIEKNVKRKKLPGTKGAAFRLSDIRSHFHSTVGRE